MTDHFWNLFIGCLVIVLSSVLSLAAFLMPQKHSIFYYACADINPAVHQNLKKLKFSQLEVYSFVFYCMFSSLLELSCLRVRAGQWLNWQPISLAKAGSFQSLRKYCFQIWQHIYVLEQLNQT